MMLWEFSPAASYFIKYEGKVPVFSDYMEYSDKNLKFWKNQVNQFAEDE